MKIELNDDLLIARGTRRACYQHPDEASLCIKISTGTPNSIKQQARECHYYRAMDKRGVDFSHLTRYEGAIETNLGTGHLYECIKDHDDTYSKSLTHYLKKNNGQQKELMLQFSNLEDYLLKHGILFYDLNGGNIICKKDPQGKLRLVMIDGIGEVISFTFLNIFKFHRDKTIRRRWQRVVKNVELSLTRS
ncbi:YrbL family protein [Rubritalea profundi]|uniref:Protein kinase domain-containing protein n=1 Tax=Rubritalea profundi TaxID=1658618 RepID=A0A2S7U025_9BACT|nr:YrbL family protein [Rubritalea profundi]PQJ27672.1 hypothetical protein BSZ32_03600 [Rubritalea profundi]